MTAVKIEEHTINDRMQVDETKRLMLPTIRWGAIFAGVVVGISVQTLLGILGIAGGLSVMNNTSGESSGFGPMLWTIVSLLISAFAGGFSLHACPVRDGKAMVPCMAPLPGPFPCCCLP